MWHYLKSMKAKNAAILMLVVCFIFVINLDTMNTFVELKNSLRKFSKSIMSTLNSEQSTKLTYLPGRVNYSDFRFKRKRNLILNWMGDSILDVENTNISTKMPFDKTVYDIMNMVSKESGETGDIM